MPVQVLRHLGAGSMPASIMCRDQDLPAHLVSQLKELLVLEAGPLPLALLAQRYEEEYSYPLEYQSLGFTCQEDLFSSPSAAAVFSLQLDGLGWSLRLLQEQEPGDYSSFRKKVEVPPEVEVRLSQLLAPGPSLQLSPTPARSAPTLQVEAMPLLHIYLGLPAAPELWLFHPLRAVLGPAPHLLGVQEERAALGVSPKVPGPGCKEGRGTAEFGTLWAH